MRGYALGVGANMDRRLGWLEATFVPYANDRQPIKSTRCGQNYILFENSNFAHVSYCYYAFPNEQTLAPPPAMPNTRKAVWLDCDPGHDDAIAILLAVHCPNIQLLGISTVRT